MAPPNKQDYYWAENLLSAIVKRLDDTQRQISQLNYELDDISCAALISYVAAAKNECSRIYYALNH